MVDIAQFFEAVERVSQGSSDNKPAPRETALATVDPAYVAPGPAQVTFDGETVLSAKAYPVVLSVAAGQRVLLIKSGHTWVILGPVGDGVAAGGGGGGDHPDSDHADAFAGLVHATRHATGGADPLAPADIGAAPSSHAHDYPVDSVNGRTGAVTGLAEDTHGHDYPVDSVNGRTGAVTGLAESTHSHDFPVDSVNGRTGAVTGLAESGHAHDYLPSGGKAADSELLDGIDSTLWLRKGLDDGTGARNTQVVTNLNARLTSGWYDGDSPTGAPGAGWWLVQVIAHSNGSHWARQIAYSMTTETATQSVYSRRCNGGDPTVASNWSAWTQIDAAAASGGGGGLSPHYSAPPEQFSKFHDLCSGGSNSSAQSGSIVVHGPPTGQNYMSIVKITVFEYSTGALSEINISGYIYSGTSIANGGYTINGSIAVSGVRVGGDGAGRYVYVIDKASAWAYPKVFVDEWYGGYTQPPASAGDGWWVEFIAPSTAYSLTAVTAK